VTVDMMKIFPFAATAPVIRCLCYIQVM